MPRCFRNQAVDRLRQPGHGNRRILFACGGRIDARLLAATVTGIGLVVAAACVANNCIDRRIDARALMLLLVMCLWQVPHSYAIAVSRMEDYAAAQLPVLPVEYGLAAARRHIAVFIATFTLATAMLTVAGIASVRFMAVNVGTGMAWLLIATVVKTHEGHRCWGRRLYITSIVTLTLSIETLKG